MSKWYNKKGNNNDIVLASKIRLARNLKSIPFPCKMTNEMRKSVCKKIYASVQNSNLAGEFDLIELDKISDLEKVSLAERGLITTRLAKNNQYSAVLVSKDEDMSVMLCEDDHIRLTTRVGGLELEKAYQMANTLDDIFIKSLNIAFDDKLGFLTSNPMNLGTGMKASVLLHLPAIAQKGIMPTLKNMLGKLGFSIKSIFADDCFFELSNEISLGITEESTINNLNGIIEQISKQERELRQELMAENDFEDKIFRAIGTLKMARQLSAKELFSLVSLARLGIALSLFDNNENIDFSTLDSMLFTLGTATIMSSTKEGLTQEEANKLRANYIRERIG